MNHLRALLLATCLALPFGSTAQGAVAPSPVELDDVASCPDVRYSLIDLLDPERSVGAKAADAEAVSMLSRHSGCTYEQYIAGSLHRLGPELPNNPFPKDQAKAEALLEAYALAGNTVAFADLAEMALASGKARDAMRWTQVYLHFAVKNPHVALQDFDRRGYNANLLARATAAWPKADMPRARIASDLGDYLAAHPGLMENVTKARSNVHTDWRGITTPEGIELRRKNPVSELRTSRVPAPGYAVFLLEIQPTGKVSRIVPETFAPNYATGAALRDLLRSMAFEPFDAADPVVARVPVQYGFDSRGPALRK
jgi:hypothetical protein